MHSGYVMSVGGKFVFYRVIRKEIYSFVRSCRLGVYVSFYIRIVPEDEKVKIIYTSIAFVCRAKLYVRMYFIYVFIDLVSGYSSCDKYD